MSNANKILIGLLVAQLLLAGYLFRDSRPSGALEQELLAGLEPDQVQELVINAPEEQQLLLMRGEGGWQVELAPGRDYPADGTKIEELLSRLAGLKSGRLVSRTRAGQKRLKVAETGYNLKLELRTGKESRTLFLGTSPSYQSIHARAGDKDEVFLVRDLALWEVPAEESGWWQSRYLDQDPEQLLEMDLVNSQGQITLVRGDVGESWRLDDGKALDDEKIKNLLAGVSRVTVNDIEADPEWRPEGSPEATLKLRNATGEIEMSVWPRADENSDYPVKLSGSEFYARAGAYTLEDILNARSTDLLPAAEKEN